MKKYLLLFLFLFPLMAFAKNENAFQAGRDYLVLPMNTSTQNFDPKDKVSVVEFFSFGCPACYHLNPTLNKWIEAKPAKVEFQRIPAVFESSWHLLARAYYVGKILGVHGEFTEPLFDAIHKQHLDLSTPPRMAAFFQKHFNIKTQDFMNTYDSPVIQAQLKKNQTVMNDFMIFQIPGVVVDGKYKIDPSLTGNNPQRFIEVLNYLIQKEKKEKQI